MQCPSCQQEPVTFKRWLIMFDPVRISCRHCQERLTLKPHWRKLYHQLSLLVALFIIVPTVLSYFDIIPLGYLNQIFILAGALVVVALVGLSAYFWKRFEYEQSQE